MPDAVNVPLLGSVPKGGLIAGTLAAVVVGGYVYIRHEKTKAAAATGTSSYGYGSTAYGYGTEASGYYGYGYGYGGMDGGGGVTPYPAGSEYGYGAYGYGYYNPYTGQYLGPGSTGSGPGTAGGGTQGGQPHKPGTHTITAPGKLDLFYLAKLNGITEARLLKLNPHLTHLKGSKKAVPTGTKVKV